MRVVRSPTELASTITTLTTVRFQVRFLPEIENDKILKCAASFVANRTIIIKSNARLLARTTHITAYLVPFLLCSIKFKTSGRVADCHKKYKKKF